jgi:hypothetical protein
MEAFLAVSVVLIFIFLTQGNNISKTSTLENKVLGILSNDEEFRNDVLSMNNYCVNRGSNLTINHKIDEIFPNYLNYTFCVYDDPRFRIDTLPDKKIYVDSYYFSGDISNYKPKVAKLFYWK